MKHALAKLVLTFLSQKKKDTSTDSRKKFSHRHDVNFDMHPQRHPHLAWQGVKLKTDSKRSRLDVILVRAQTSGGDICLVI